MIEIETATADADIERWLRVRNAVDPRPLTLAGFHAERIPAIAELTLIAVEAGRDLGASSIGWSEVGRESRTAFIDVWVLTDARRRGIGGRLVDQSATFARELGIERVRANVVDGDTESMRFGERRGLRHDGGGQVGVLDLTAAAPEPRAAPTGFVVTSFAERPDLERELYELEMSVRPEVPTLRDEPTPTFEAWVSQSSGDAGFLPELSLLALDGDHLVGSIAVYDNGDETAFIGMTAVHRDARRRGLARTLKIDLARRARTAGIRRIETFNDGTNEGIRGLNESLGYVYGPMLHWLIGPLPAGGRGPDA